MTVKAIHTRFRAYQLGQAGSSFSYYADGKFTLIEARLTDVNVTSVRHEMAVLGVTQVDCLHITSWDQDHCSISCLEKILEQLHPKKIEYPGYTPESDCARNCLAAIQKYKIEKAKKSESVESIAVTPDYIDGLKPAEDLGYKNIFFWPKAITETANDNSTVKFFRTGCFNVLSLGDVESDNIGSFLRSRSTLQRETDILILAHHGANCFTNSKNLLERIKPSVAICSSNFDNQYDHPHDDVRNSLYELEIPVYTTKTGDVIIESVAPHTNSYMVYNLIAKSTKVSSQRQFKIKKHHLLSMNMDTLRQIYKNKPSFPK